jgi:hypothetical protein
VLRAAAWRRTEEAVAFPLNAGAGPATQGNEADHLCMPPGGTRGPGQKWHAVCLGPELTRTRATPRA